MKKLLFLSILFFIGLMGNAQRVYFIYLQSDNAIPFYVKMGDKIHSSSAAGYLILSNLKDSTYSFSVGLLGKQQVEPKFKVDISSGDRGFLIKQMDQKLSLFDLHSMELLLPLAAAEMKKEEYITRTDNFTRTLSQAANDPSILLEIVRKEPVKEVVKDKEEIKETKPDVAIVKEEKPIDTTAVALVTPPQNIISKDTAVVKDTAAIVVAEVNTSIDTATVTTASISKDTMAIAQATPLKTEEKEEEIVKKDEKVEPVKSESVTTTEASTTGSVAGENKVSEIEYQKSRVVRRSESSTSEGFGLTFIDYLSDGSDTIRLLIPNPKTPYIAPVESAPPVKEDVKQLEVLTDAPTQIDITTVAPKNSCNATASEADFRKLRKDMAAQEADDDMIGKAQIAFKNKCFTTEQIKNLSTLFLSAAGKYQFFDTAYRHVSDSENFASLASELKEEEFATRFKALISQ